MGTKRGALVGTVPYNYRQEEMSASYEAVPSDLEQLEEVGLLNSPASEERLSNRVEGTEGAEDLHSFLQFEYGDKHVAEQDETQDGSYWQQLRLLLELTVPSILSQITMIILGTISMAYVGTVLGRHALTGFSVASLAANLLGMSFIYGILNGMDTLAPQAVGAKEYPVVGYLAQTAMIVCFSFMILIVVLFWNAEPILRAMKQPEESIALAVRFLKLYCISLPLDILYQTFNRFLVCQSIVRVFVVIGLLTCVLHAFYLHLFITWLNLGFDGAIVAYIASGVSRLIFCFVYFKIWSPHHPETWTGINLREALRFKRLARFLQLAIPGIFSKNEWWFWEVVCVLAGQLGEIELASHTIAYNLIPLAFMLPLGVAIATSTRLGILLAQEKYQTAYRVGHLAFLLGFAAGMTNALLFFSFRDHLIALFAGHDEEVIQNTKKVWYYCVMYVVPDAAGGALFGVFWGLGAQVELLGTTILSLWVVGLPAMYYWSFELGHGLVGIWQAMNAISVAFTVASGVTCFYCVDWTKAVKNEQDSRDENSRDENQ